MGIRDTSYYGWSESVLVESTPEFTVSNLKITDMTVDSKNNIYVTGGISSNWVILKSVDLGFSWTIIDSLNRDNGTDQANAIAIDSNDNIYVVGYETVNTPHQSFNWIVRKSTTGASGSFTYIDNVNRDNSIDQANAIAIDSNDNIYVAGYENVTTQASNWIVRKSTTGASGSFTYIDNVNRDNSDDQANAIAIDSNDNIYVVGFEAVVAPPLFNNWIVRKSTTGASGSFIYIDSLDRDGGFDQANAITIDLNDNIWVAGVSSNKSLLRRGKLTANSASLGPKMFATSFGYVFDEPVSGALDERFKLNNISEFPHSSGIFQMPNIILGTTDSGEAGNTEDNIIQVSHVGSVVHVMWPQQNAGIETFVQGFGSFATGQKPGKLTTAFATGSFFDVTEFDHLALYSYISKISSGTLDNIDIRVERRPLRSTPFTVDQAVEYTTSGSDALATYRDLIHTKQIDYGDLSIRDIGWVIDVPLTNVRELRVSARHRVGQSDDKNKNCVIWGRLINSIKET